MFKTLFNAWKIPELRKKILYTLLLLAIFRFGCHITAPGVNLMNLQKISEYSQENPILNTVNIITGGAFSSFSIFALSISPYITASIVMQLLTFAIPALEEISKEGENGRKRISQYTRYVAVILAAIEGFGIYMMYRNPNQGIFIQNGALAPLMFVLTLAIGSALLMWIADQLSSKGIGNGTSLLIFAGIISQLPQAATYLASVAAGGTTGILVVLGVLIGAILLIAGVIWVTEAERRIPVQYAKRVVGRKMYGGQSTHIPMKLAMAGVMPVIFAMSFMQLPAIIIQLINNDIMNATGFWAGVYKVFAFTSLQDVALINATTGAFDWAVLGYGLLHILIYVILIVAFTFFYTMGMAFNPIEVANNLKKNGGFIPGIRAGKPTSDYLSTVLTSITAFGSIFLAIVAVLPILTQFFGLSISFGGTAILIVVGVALESVRQLESQMLTRHYKGFLE
ncbi:MAG: preprotein translocase subunit SecY [Clostridia bacterium]|nr:preprotein translocase subunit SecY [Clostridia bacterium]